MKSFIAGSRSFMSRSVVDDEELVEVVRQLCDENESNLLEYYLEPTKQFL
jgi:hypothetical protein